MKNKDQMKVDHLKEDLKEEPHLKERLKIDHKDHLRIDLLKELLKAEIILKEEDILGLNLFFKDSIQDFYSFQISSF